MVLYSFDKKNVNSVYWISDKYPSIEKFYLRDVTPEEMSVIEFEDALTKYTREFVMHQGINMYYGKELNKLMLY